MWLKVYFNGDSCQITHRPESAVFCTLSLCLCFCHTWVESILFFGTVTNQTGQDDEEEPAVLEIEPLHSFFFFFPLKNISSCSPRHWVHLSSPMPLLSCCWVPAVPLVWVIHCPDWLQAFGAVVLFQAFRRFRPNSPSSLIEYFCALSLLLLPAWV